MRTLKLTSFAAAGFCVLVLLTGCSGGNNSSTPAPAPTYLNITGNWGLTATSTTYQGASEPVGVQLTESNGAVTGIAHIISACYQITDNVPLTGSEDYNGNITLTSTSVNGQVLTITGKLASATSLASGNYTIAVTNGCKDAGTITGGVVSTISGTYTGSVKSLANAAVYPLSATLTQISTIDVNGFEHLSGSAAFTGSPCLAAALNIATPASDSMIIGNVYLATFGAGSSPSVLMYGTLSADAKTINVNYQVATGTCKGDYGSGTLTRQ